MRERTVELGPPGKLRAAVPARAVKAEESVEISDERLSVRQAKPQTALSRLSFRTADDGAEIRGPAREIRVPVHAVELHHGTRLAPQSARARQSVPSQRTRYVLGQKKVDTGVVQNCP